MKKRRISTNEETEMPAGRIVVDGVHVEVTLGDSLLHVLFELGKIAISQTDRGVNIGAFCGMGICYSCVVLVDNRKVRACAQNVVRDMRVETRRSLFRHLSESVDHHVG